MQKFLQKILNKKAFALWRSKQQFKFNGKQLNYFSHQYNWTWLNERAVEISIVWELLKEYQGKDILEVGNVLAHYFDTKHNVVDKYEKAPSVINQDIVTFKSRKKFDLIIAISTFEHIGWDEKKRDKEKILKAIANCKKLLKKDGQMLITFPLGHNEYLDELVYKKKLPLKLKFMKRVNLLNDWQEISFREVKRLKAKYGKPFPNANVIGVGKLD